MWGALSGGWLEASRPAGRPANFEEASDKYYLLFDTDTDDLME